MSMADEVRFEPMLITIYKLKSSKEIFFGFNIHKVKLEYQQQQSTRLEMLIVARDKTQK